MPTIKPYYAVKCNPEPLLLKWLQESGAGFDCASKREIDLLSESSDIIYANPCKASTDIEYAMKKGVRTTVVDSVEEIHKLADVGWNGDALIRIRVDDSGSAMPFSTKFGAPMSLLETLAKEAAHVKLMLKGISFHVGSGCGNPLQFQYAIQSATRGLHILKQYGHTPQKQILDIGGGFVGEPFFTPAASIINKVISHLKHPPTIIAEPGRFFAATSHDLFTQVIGKKPASNGSGWRYTIDESLYGQFSCIPFDQATPKWIRIGDGKRKSSPAVIFGRTCDSVDMIACAEFAEELEVGDWLWWPNMGAYTSVTATEFNGFPRPPVVSVEDPLPSPNQVDASWPMNIQYVSSVKTPLQ